MKNFTKEELEAGRPRINVYTAIIFCLEQLYADKKCRLNANVCKDLTYEELIGALLLSKDFIEYSIKNEVNYDY